MAGNYFISLLRGINVGGNNIIKMTDLKLCFEKMGFGDVVTYIQSGNVLFTAKEKDKSALAEKIEQGLSKRFSYMSRQILISYSQFDKIVHGAPEGFGTDPENYKYDVIFLKDQHEPSRILKSLRITNGVDQAWAGESVLYFSRLKSGASRSSLTKIISLPVYQDLTVRNWNTTTRLLGMLDENLKVKQKTQTSNI